MPLASYAIIFHRDALTHTAAGRRELARVEKKDGGLKKTVRHFYGTLSRIRYASVIKKKKDKIQLNGHTSTRREDEWQERYTRGFRAAEEIGAE